LALSQSGSPGFGDGIYKHMMKKKRQTGRVGYEDEIRLDESLEGKVAWEQGTARSENEKGAAKGTG